jgi:hypothetical protein
MPRAVTPALQAAKSVENKVSTEEVADWIEKYIARVHTHVSADAFPALFDIPSDAKEGYRSFLRWFFG